MILRSDIAKMEDTLKDYETYKKFLDRVTPQVSFRQTTPILDIFKFKSTAMAC